MELKKLHKDLISKLRSTFTINTFTQCVMELVYNSLDANCTAVAIRINFVTYRIQIVDNGDGISKDNMSQVGIRYMTNKCKGLQDFQKQVKYYGYRGEALASIMECSKSVNVTSRHKDTSETYSKTLQTNGNEHVNLIKTRPSSGTTITVEGVFYNLAVRRNRIVPELELDDLKTFIQNIIMMHPNVSFTIRDDVSSELLLNSQKHKDIIAALKYFHPEIDCDFSLLKVSKNRLTVEALLFKDLYDNKNVQYIFVNKRPVHSAKIHKCIVSMISKNRKNIGKRIENLNKTYPMYIVNIKCPYALVSYSTAQTKTTVEFADWNLLFRYIEKLVYSFYGNEEKLRQQRKPPPPPPDDFILDCGPSQIHGAVKAYGYKRCNKENRCEDISEKVPKMQEDHDFESPNVNKLLRRRTAESITEKLPTLQIEPTAARNNEDLGNQNVKESDTNKMCDKYFDDAYHISDTTPQEKSKISFKKPLPIRIICKDKQQASCLYTNMEISPAQQDVFKYPQNISQKKPIDEQSAITAFNNDEVKGKNLIMDMFLKSTQIFNSDESCSDVRSEGTIFEVESDMLLENNITSKVNGCTKTMSISVNVKSKQKLKRRKKPRSKISKCVQTTFRSKSVKSVKVKKVKQVENKAFEDVCANECPGEYTIVFSNTTHPNKEPKFKFIPHNSGTECGDMNANDIYFENFCVCRCHSDKDKLFSFQKEERQDAAVCDNENTGNRDKLLCGKKKQNAQKRDPKYHGKPQYNDIDVHAQHKQSDPHKYNQHQLIEDSLKNHFHEDALEMCTHQNCEEYDLRKIQQGIDFRAKNRDAEQMDGNIQQMYTHQSFDPRKYDKNIHSPDNMCSNNQVLQAKGYCQDTVGNIQTCTLNQKHDTNIRYGSAFFNNVNDLNRYALLPEKNPDGGQVDGNIQKIYTRQSFDPRKYDNNIHPPEKNCFNNKALQVKDCCQHTTKNIQTYTLNQKADTNFLYEIPCFNNFNELNRYAQLQNYTNEYDKPNYTNFNPREILKCDSNIRNNEKTGGHVHTLRQNFQQPFPQLNCQDIYGAVKNYHQSSMYPNNACHNDPIPKLVDCVKTKNQNLNFCHQALPTQSPYFKRPPIHETNMFFVEPKVPKMKKKLNTATAESPYFSKHDNELHIEADVYNQQVLEHREKQKTDNHNFVEEQNVFQCGSEQTLSKNFDTQFLTKRSYSGEKSEDLFSPHNVFENNSTIISFNQFSPEYLSTQIGEVAKATDDNFEKLVEAVPFQDTCEAPNHTTRDGTKFFPTASSQLCITLSNNQKQNLLDEELEQDKMFDVKKFEEWISQPTKTIKQDNFFAEGWIKQADKCGNFYYVSKQTGYATYNTPNQEPKNCFKVTERYEFVPKGFSPMLVETEPVDRSLSQNKKDKLLKYIMETYQTDLKYVKWRNYMDHIDPDVFFDKLYKEKVKQYEGSIPNVALLQARDKFRTDQISFNKEVFLNIKVIGQIDKKFICVLEPKQNLLILFDQHAVHERIRLEKLLTDYKDSKCKCDEIVVFLPKTHLKLLVKHDKYINSLGLTVTHYTNSINITEIPSYIYHKFKDSEAGSLAKVIQLLMKEVVELLRSTRGSEPTSLPKCLQDIISLEACRGNGEETLTANCSDIIILLPNRAFGAIKFGDLLSKEQCTDLLKILSSCNLPFQCAHGRPTLVPLMHLKMMDENIYAKQKIHFKNIKSPEL